MTIRGRQTRLILKKWGNKLSKIMECDPDSFSVHVRFQDGTRGVISLKHIFEKPKGLSAEILKGGMFEKCFVESGALAWPNGFELCPDALKQWFTEQHNHSRRDAA
ncbi:MAG: DUF2442 domain-containing protein [Deltaproteobacteria bacterium]|nr:DUF2442 domain-containing protein [Deltaproteobacteria bacterium]